MNGNQYFENNPWERVITLINEKNLGPIHEIIATPVVKKEDMEHTFKIWKDRARTLVGDEQEGYEEKEDNVISYFGVYGDNTLVRFFIDCGSEDISENFEVVTDKSLIVWKPIGTNQGHICLDEGSTIQTSQKYVADLEKGPSFGR